MYLISGGIVQKLLYQLKYNGKKEIGNFLGKMYASHLKHLDHLDMIVPVPIHASRLRSRGYNQSKNFADGLSDVLAIEVRDDLVERITKTETQTNKSKIERWENVTNIYSEIKADIAGSSVLIVDDAITTGATISMLCERFVEAEVKEIHLASIARGK
ncbi:MAG: phosphoribosyltransferase family protein [Bacteroidota bacterium]